MSGSNLALTQPPVEQLEIGKVTPVFPRSVDSTILSAFASCPQRFFNEFCLRIAPRGIAPHLHAGGAFAAALEHVRREIWQNGRALEDAIASASIAFVRQWGDYEPPEGSGAESKDSTNMFCALVAYFGHWEPDKDVLKPLMIDGKPSLEFTFALPTEVQHPITGDPILYSGRCDMIGEYEGLIAPVDEKTSKGIGPGWERQWQLRGQFLGYVYAVRQYGFPCRHAVARGVGILKTEYKFAEAFITFPDFLLDEWWRAVNQKLRRMVDMWNRMQEDMRTRSWHDFWDYDFADACNSYGGCSYKMLCRTKEKEPWYSDYDRRVWDPLKKDPTEGSVSRLITDEAQVDKDLLKQMGIEL